MFTYRLPENIRPHGADLAVTGVVADGATVRVAFAGEVDMSTASAFAGAINEAAGAWPRLDVGVDLAGVRFLDSTGIQVLLDCRRRADRQGRTLVVTGVQPRVCRVLEITGVDKLLLADGSGKHLPGGDAASGARAEPCTADPTGRPA